MFFFILQLSFSTVIGIDLGSDTIKVSVGSSRKPVHLARNLYSHELTPNIFMFRDKSNWAFGEVAVDQYMLHPERCVVGLPFDNKLYFGQLYGYEITALSLLQILKDIKNTEQIPDDDDIKVIIAIPPSMTNREKSYLYNALTVAKINCVQFITSSYAPIELYVAEKRYPMLSRSAVFVDIGHGGVRLSAFEFTESKIKQIFSEYNDNIGGKTIDESLFEYVVSYYRLKINDEKSRVQLLSEIKKAKEVLTVQNKASFMFKDRSYTIQKSDIEKSCKEITSTLNQMIKSLQRVTRVDKIQLLGGCSRIPYIQKFIEKDMGIKTQKVLDINSAVSMGACYTDTSEISNRVTERSPLISFEAILRSGGNVYKIFNFGNSENSNPAVRVQTEPLQLFQVIDKSDEQEFIRFTIGGLRFSSNVELGFTLNYYLMPVPDPPQFNGGEGRIEYERVGWEVAQSKLRKSEDVIRLMINGINRRLKSEMKSNLIEAYKLKIQDKMKKYGLLNWRRFALTGIYMYIDSHYSQCIEDGCSEQQENDILKQLKSMIKFIINISDDDDRIDPGLSPERRRLVEKLYDILEVCRAAGARVDDIERWINKKLNMATDEEIIENIGILKERGRSKQKFYDDL